MATNIKNKIEYELRKASEQEKNLLIKYKLSTIYCYANDITVEEKDRINKYVLESIEEDVKEYNLIIIDNKIIGAFLLKEYDDGMLLDEIYIEDAFRGLGIGSRILRDITLKNDIVYLWVYKDNEKAIKLYKDLDFMIVNETEFRYFMKRKGNE